MPQTNFRSLQNLHETLLQEQQAVTEENQQDFTQEVREYIEQAKRAGSYISLARERDQIRANLRYWGNYVYGIDKTFPDTELAPSSVEDKVFLTSTIGRLTIIALGIIVLAGVIFASRAVFMMTAPPAAETATALLFTTPTMSPTIPATATSASVQAATSPTPEPSGLNVILSSPVNGDSSITPNIEFEGTYDNLRPGWTIHILFIREGKYFPVKEYYTISDQTSGDWSISTRLTEPPEEMGKAQSYSIVSAICIDPPFDRSNRDLLSNSSETGIDINSLPVTVITFPDTSRVIYRAPYKVIRETRMVYSFFDGTSYDLYTSRPDGRDMIRITETQGYSEMFPNLSPDGTKIVYVKRFRETNTAPWNYTLAIMDSNGHNDHEIIKVSRNVLENPQWSPDVSYISYAMGETRGSSNTVYWSIHAYNLLSGEGKNVSGEPQAQVSRYSSWLPNANILIFDAAVSDRTRFIQVPIDSLNQSVFFDPIQYVIQPSITPLGDGYVLMYTVIGPAPNYSHDIYAAIDLDGQDRFDGVPIPLIRSGGEVVDFPQPDPDSKTLYYTRNGAILRVEYQVQGGQITLIRKANTNSRGETIIEAGPTREAIYFDVGWMDTFFEIK